MGEVRRHMTTITAERLAADAVASGDSRFCGVIAVAIAADLDYDTAAKEMRKVGRHRNEGSHGECYLRALHNLDYDTELIRPYGDLETVVTGEYTEGPGSPLLGGYLTAGVRTPMTLKAALIKHKDNGIYLVRYRQHIACVKNTLFHDWTGGRRHRILEMWRVTPRW